MSALSTAVRRKDYFLSIIHVVLAVTLIAAALTHLGNAFSTSAPHLARPILILLAVLGVFSLASLIFARALRATFLGVFAVLMLFNAFSDFSRWGWLPSLRISYGLELLAFLLGAVGLGIHLARTLARSQEPIG
jgi:hypothetical protein